MKKKILSYSLLVLAIMLAAVSVQAQTLGAYKAQIPFDFTVEERSYEAGDYKIRVKSPNYLATFLAVSNAKGEELQVIAVMRNGDWSKKDGAYLVFNHNGDQYVLKQITAPGFGFSLPKSKTDITVLYKEGPQPTSDTVSIVLKRRE